MKFKFLFVVTLIFLISFLGLPIPGWLENIVNIVAGIITTIIDIILKILKILSSLANI